MQKISALCLCLVLLGGLCACTTVDAPVSARRQDQRPEPVVFSGAGQDAGQHEFHSVAKGDTLYSIAWRYGYDHKTLAAWNRIKPPFVIYPGQVIRFRPGTRGRAAQPPPVAEQRPRARDKPVKPDPQNRAGAPASAIRWQWPARGRLLKSSSPTTQKGISIGGAAGQKIVAAATGKVVYSGSGLRGYGNLIIIKHNDTYLSAYAHNRELIVKEGETVEAGQQISTMGQDGKGAPVLHFEIRKNGEPVNPLERLPRS